MINNTSGNSPSLKVSFFRKYYIIGIKLNSKGGVITRMLNLDKLYVSQLIYFIGSKLILLCHRLLKNKRLYNLQREMP